MICISDEDAAQGAVILNTYEVIEKRALSVSYVFELIMADIIDAAQTDQPTPSNTPASGSPPPDNSVPSAASSPLTVSPPEGDSTTPAPVEPPPTPPDASHAMSSDSLVVPPPPPPVASNKDTKKPQNPPPDAPPKNPPMKGDATGKKKIGVGPLLAGLLLLLITLPLGAYFVSQQQSINDVRSRATGGACGASCTCGGIAPYYTCYPGCASGLTCSKTNGTGTCGGAACNNVCGPAGKSCGGSGDCGGATCQSQNWVCVGVSGAKTCQQHGPDICTGGGTCNRIDAYHCDKLTNGECHSGQATVGSWSAGVSHANGCGQVDQVCTGGTNDGTGCGDFEIISNLCGPGTTATETQPPPEGPSCSNLSAYKDGVKLTLAQLKQLNPGDKVKFHIAGANSTKGHYRIKAGSEAWSAWTEITSKNAAGEYVSQDYTIPTNTINFSIESEVYGHGEWD